MHRELFTTSFSIFFCVFVFAQEPKLMLPIGHTLPPNSAQFSPDGKKIITSADGVKIWDVASGNLLTNLSSVVNAQFSPDGKKIVAASRDSIVQIWDVASGKVVIKLKGHTAGVNSAQFSPDGKKIVTASQDYTAKIWDVGSGKLIADLIGHTKGIRSFQFSPDGKKIVANYFYLYRGLKDTVTIWDAFSGKRIADLIGHTDAVTSAQFSPNGKTIVTASLDKTAKIWDAASGKLTVDLKGHTRYVFSAQFSPDGKKIVTASSDSVFKVWDAISGNLIVDLKGHSYERNNPRPGENYAQFSPDGKKIVTASGDMTPKIWDVASGKIINELKGHTYSVYIARFSPDGKKIVTASYDNTAKIWDVDSGVLQSDLTGHTKDFRFAIFSPNGKKIFTSSTYDTTPKLWDAISGKVITDLKGHTKNITSAQFSPDGKIIVTSSADNTAKLWDVASGKPMADLKGHTGFVHSAQFSSDGRKVLTTSLDSTAKIWDVVTGNIVADLKGHKGILWSGQFSPNNEKIVTASFDKTAKIWDVATGNIVADLKGHNRIVRSAQFSPDGGKIVTASDDSTAKIWDAVRGTLIANLKGHTSDLRSAEFSPDGKKIVTASRDMIAKIWNVDSGELIADLKGHTRDLWSAQFSPDGKTILTASANDKIAKIWDADFGNLIADLNEHTNGLWSAQFSPDGKKIVTASQDNTAKIWDVKNGKVLYTFIMVDSDDYLIIDKDNRYDGTPAARKLLYFTCGTEIIELDQVKDQLWVPNLAERIMNGDTINAQKLSDLNICNLSPVVETIEQSALQYRFQITPRLGGLGASIVYVNGIEVKKYSPQQLIPKKGGYQLVIEKKELQKYFVTNKENTITVKALTAKNSISSRFASLSEKGNEKSTASPNLYAVVVGISDYKGEELDLKFAAKDAVDIGNAIDASAKKLLNADGKEHVFIYKINTGTSRDKFPEKNTIRQVFTEIAGKAQPNDILLIFFAGHGVMETLSAGQAGEKNQFYFLTADASNATVTGALKDVGISTEEISDWIKPQVMKAQKRILIFDACNSGQVIKEMISIGQKGQNYLASRGDEMGKQIKAIEKLNERSGMFILSASASDQKAYEMGKYNQGTLTYSLLRAIKEEPDILEDRKFLNVSRWFNAAEKSVGELARETGASQQPQVVSTTNFNIGVVDEDVRNKIVLPFEKPMLTRSEFRNTDLRLDNLKLRAMVDKELDEISGHRTGSSIMYSPEYDGANIYAISGDYTITGNNAVVSVFLTKGGTEIRTKFEIKGTVSQPETIAKSIVNAVIEYFNDNKE